MKQNRAIRREVLKCQLVSHCFIATCRTTTLPELDVTMMELNSIVQSSGLEKFSDNDCRLWAGGENSTHSGRRHSPAQGGDAETFKHRRTKRPSEMVELKPVLYALSV